MHTEEIVKADIIQVKTKEQIKSVYELADEIWHEHYEKILKQNQIDFMVEHFQSEDSIARSIEFNNYEYFLIIIEGKNAGYFALSPTKDGLFLSKLYLKKNLRGKGVGKACVKFIENYALWKKMDRIWLTVNRNNLGAITIYKKLGFEVTDSSVTEIGGGFVMDDFIMTKKIDRD